MKKLIIVVAVTVVSVAATALAQEEDFQKQEKTKVKSTTSTPMKVVDPVGVAEAQKGRGKIFVKENSWDFGHVAQNTRVTHEFTVENVGDDTLFIERIKPT